MTDEVLLLFGCGVTFLAIAGAYVLLRGRLLDIAATRTRLPKIEEARVAAPAKS